MNAQHEYQPDPVTGRCLGPHDAASRGGCLWCGHQKARHTGRVDDAVRRHYQVESRQRDGSVVIESSVKFTTSACGASHCACRRYES